MYSLVLVMPYGATHNKLNHFNMIDPQIFPFHTKGIVSLIDVISHSSMTIYFWLTILKILRQLLFGKAKLNVSQVNSC